MKVSPLTGRTHQIRIHFRDIGHPLLGERLYAFRKDFQVDCKRLALHLNEVRWQQPITHKKVMVTSDLPEDMKAFLKKTGHTKKRNELIR